MTYYTYGKYISWNFSLFALDYWLNVCLLINWIVRQCDELTGASSRPPPVRCVKWKFGKGVPVENNRGTQYKDHSHRYGYETVAWNVAVVDDSLIVQNEHYMLRKTKHTYTLQLYYTQDTKYAHTLDIISLKLKSSTWNRI